MAAAQQIRPFTLDKRRTVAQGKKRGTHLIRGGPVMISDDFEVVTSGTKKSVALRRMSDGIIVSSQCVCDGGGSCDTIITVDGPTGRKKMSCRANGCAGGCGIEITLPANSVFARD
jgi:hypothetical protein